jgi:heme exporter protein A
MKIRLIIDNLAKSYPGRPVFENVSAQVEHGERLIITGPNGSGKSTMVRILCAFARPSKGDVALEIDDSKLSRLEMRPHIGLVSPDLVLYDELTALENMSFFSGVAGHHFEKPELVKKISSVGLEGREDDFVGSYSSGMKQRLKYCLAILSNPELLILDEPTSNLDARGKELADEIIRSHTGIVIIATNESSELKYGDQLVKLGG